MTNHGKLLFNTDVKGILDGKDLKIGVYGIFSTEKVRWSYYIISFVVNSKGFIELTDDICSVPYSHYNSSLDYIRKYGKSVNSIQEGESYCIDFKMKWESGQNSTTAEMREQKLNELLK